MIISLTTASYNYCCLFLILLITVFTKNVIAIKKYNNNKNIDLSYLPHLNSKMLIDAFQDSVITMDTSTTDKNVDVINIDISDSNLRDIGFIQFIDAIIMNNKTSTIIKIHTFKARRNNLTPKAANAFFKKMVAVQNNNNNNSISNTTASNTTTTEHSHSKTANIDSSSSSSSAIIKCLDLGWNRLFDDDDDSTILKDTCVVLEKFISSTCCCPEILKLSCTNIGSTICRSVGKGMISSNNATSLRELYISNNPDIGNAGTAALAAALCIILEEKENSNNNNDTKASSSSSFILDVLDLSSCHVGDAGIQALCVPFMIENYNAQKPIRTLLLCNNEISDVGSIAFGRSILSSTSNNIECIDLSNNPKITDKGISTLLNAIQYGTIKQIKLKSCSIHADGAEIVGKTLCAIATATTTNDDTDTIIEIDLSGNPIGSLRGKSKNKDDKYSASRLKSKASATASAYMNHGLSFFKGLSAGLVNSNLSDDDEDENESYKKKGNPFDSNNNNDNNDDSNKRCGFKAMANAFLNAKDEKMKSITSTTKLKQKIIRLGLRRTFCDTAGADALAALIIAGKEIGLDIQLDMKMNPVLEEEMVDALQTTTTTKMLLLQEMADRHNDAMEVIRIAQERATQAAKVAAARVRAEAAFEKHWGNAPPTTTTRKRNYNTYNDDYDDYDNQDDEWDSDADYENDDEGF